MDGTALGFNLSFVAEQYSGKRPLQPPVWLSDFHILSPCATFQLKTECVCHPLKIVKLCFQYTDTWVFKVVTVIFKTVSLTKRTKISDADGSERKTETSLGLFQPFNCLFWSFSGKLKTINGDWIGSEESEVALWGHVSQGNLRLRDEQSHYFLGCGSKEGMKDELVRERIAADPNQDLHPILYLFATCICFELFA